MASRQSSTKHPLYKEFQPVWDRCFDVYEGAGGFLDPKRPYLIPHPREWNDHSIQELGDDGVTPTGRRLPNPSPRDPSPKLRMRWKLARYENVAATIIDTLQGTLFGVPPTRTVEQAVKDDEQIRRWWLDADGLGRSINDLLMEAWIGAGVFGHSFLVAEPSAPGATVADMKAPPISLYSPLDAIDWLTDERGQLTSIKLLHAAPRASLDVPAKPSDLRVRVIDAEQYVTYDSSGKVLETIPHTFGALPVVVLYSRKRSLIPVIGKSVLGDPNVFIDLYNLVSEGRELIRNQAFAMLNVPIGREGSAESERTLMGQQTGTAAVLFSTNPAQILEPSGTSLQSIHAEIDRTVRQCYRNALVSWEGDSRDAEAADSKRLKREDMRAALTKFATGLATAEKKLTELVFRGVYGDRWEAEMDRVQPRTKWPEEFTLPDFDGLIERTIRALTLDLGATASKQLKKDTAKALLPDLPKDQAAQIDAEIDGQEILTAVEKQDRMIEQSAQRMAEAGKKVPPPAKGSASVN